MAIAELKPITKMALNVVVGGKDRGMGYIPLSHLP